MTAKRSIAYRFWRTFLSLMLLASVIGCTVRYVAEYDASIKDEIVRIAKDVDLFYGRLLEAPSGERQYRKYKDDYLKIEADLRALELRNEIRTFNKESTKQTKIALDLWMEDKESHKKEDTVDDATLKLHRKQFARVFVAMAKGEEAKR
jgi:hypothetical protein